MDSDKVAKVIIIRKNTILFLQNDNGTWELPGGHLNVGEKYKQGAKREVMEETGIVISKLKLITQGKNFKMFTALPKINKVTLSDEHIDYKWFNNSQIKKINLSKSTRLNLKFILNTV